MKILSVDRDVQGILTSSYFEIPRFQRPYSWDKSNLDDFWQDAVVPDAGRANSFLIQLKNLTQVPASVYALRGERLGWRSY